MDGITDAGDKTIILNSCHHPSQEETPCLGEEAGEDSGCILSP